MSSANSPEDEHRETEQAAAVPPLSPELAKLLDERIATAKANPGVGYTMEEVIAYVKRKK